jgi:hypothetical protein
VRMIERPDGRDSPSINTFSFWRIHDKGIKVRRFRPETLFWAHQSDVDQHNSVIDVVGIETISTSGRVYILP